MKMIIIEKSMNNTPEEAISERIAQPLKDGYRVVSATTSLSPHGRMSVDGPEGLYHGVAMHVYYVTTVVLEKEG